MNIVDLPDDVQYSFITHLKECSDLINLKKTCKTFRNLVNKESKYYQVDLFKFQIKLFFTNCDLKKHEMICKKFTKFKEYFNLHKIHINRKHDSRLNIFHTTTYIYIEIYYDDVKKFNNIFNKFLIDVNLYNILKKSENLIDYKLYLFYKDDIYNFVNTNIIDKKDDFLISNKSKINLEEINTLLRLQNNNCNDECENIKNNFNYLPYKLGLDILQNVSILTLFDKVRNNNLILSISQLLYNIDKQSRVLKSDIHLLKCEIRFERTSFNPDITILDTMQRNLIKKRILLKKVIKYRLLLSIKGSNIKRKLIYD